MIPVGRQFELLAEWLPRFIAQQVSMTEPRRRRHPEAERIPGPVRGWLLHLCLLDAMAGAVQFSANDLTAAEVRGLGLLRAERERFWHEHRRHECGAVNPAGAPACSGCRTVFQG